MSQCPSAAARAVVDVPGVIVAAKHTNAQVKARELIIVLVNFGFIVIVSFSLSFLVLAFRSSSSWGVISGRSLEYRTETTARLCGNGSAM
jgi:hypothetical protein